MRVTGIDHIVVVAPDPLVLVDWYRDRLGLAPERVDSFERGEVLFPSVRIDATTIIDVLPGEPVGRNVDHICLVLTEVDLADLVDSGEFEVLSEPAELWGARGTGWSIYVRDPIGNTVELRTYDGNR